VNKASDDELGPQYRAIIDRLVNDCEHGQGQVAPRRIVSGVWNANATVDVLPEQARLNGLLAGLDSEHRAAIAAIASDCFVAGVHQTLVALHEAGIKPFDDGVEGTPFADFIGRLQGWDWPNA